MSKAPRSAKYARPDSGEGLLFVPGGGMKLAGDFCRGGESLPELLVEGLVHNVLSQRDTEKLFDQLHRDRGKAVDDYLHDPTPTKGQLPPTLGQHRRKPRPY